MCVHMYKKYFSLQGHLFEIALKVLAENLSSDTYTHSFCFFL